MRRLYVALRWLGPWAIVLALSALIAHTAEAVLFPSVSLDLAASPAPMFEPGTRSVVESQGSLTRVICAADPDEGEVDVLVTGLQDLMLLEDGRCEVRL